MTPTTMDAGGGERQRLHKRFAAFDRQAVGRWDLANPGTAMIVRERHGRLLNWMAEDHCLPLGDRLILEIGCGVAHESEWLLHQGAAPTRLTAVDLAPERLCLAHARVPVLQLVAADAACLPFQSHQFDLVWVADVFSSVLDPYLAEQMAQSVNRVLKPGGFLAWYDFRWRHPLNRAARGISRQQLTAWFPGYTGRLETVTLLPPLARRLGRLTSLVYPWLMRVPFLRGHWLGLLRKPEHPAVVASRAELCDSST